MALAISIGTESNRNIEKKDMQKSLWMKRLNNLQESHAIKQGRFLIQKKKVRTSCTKVLILKKNHSSMNSSLESA